MLNVNEILKAEAERREEAAREERLAAEKAAEQARVAQELISATIVDIFDDLDDLAGVSFKLGLLQNAVDDVLTRGVSLQNSNAPITKAIADEMVARIQQLCDQHGAILEAVNDAITSEQLEAENRKTAAAFVGNPLTEMFAGLEAMLFGECTCGECDRTVNEAGAAEGVGDEPATLTVVIAA